MGVSVNVIWVTSQGLCGEHIHQCEMFAIRQYVVKLVIKPRIFKPVARRPVLTWQEVCTKIVVCGLKCCHPSMKTIRSLITELRHILALYIMCLCDLDLWPIFTKIGSRDLEFMMNIFAYLEVYRRFSLWNMRPQNVDLVAHLLGNRHCHGSSSC